MNGNIVITAISTNQWRGQWMGRQHLMWAMKEFAPVLYVQEPRSWHKGWGCRDESFFRPRSAAEHDQLKVLRLPKVLCRRGGEGRWNRWTFAQKSRQIRRRITGSGRQVVLYLWEPGLWPYAEHLKPDFVVYHLYDMVPQFHLPEYSNSPARRQFERACREADLVIALTADQAARMPRKDVAIVPSGVDVDYYGAEYAEPKEMQGIPHPRIGYVGTISEKVDLAWLERIAAIRGWHLLLIGPIKRLRPDSERRLNALRARQNVHSLGCRAALDLPSYVKHLDVGLMCYRRGLFCEAGSPLKLYEYCAAGIPAVGSKLKSLVNGVEISRFVTLVDTAHEAVNAIRCCLSSSSNEERAMRREFAARNTWRKRAQQIIGLITQSPACQMCWRNHAAKI